MTPTDEVPKFIQYQQYQPLAPPNPQGITVASKEQAKPLIKIINSLLRPRNRTSSKTRGRRSKKQQFE
jgi:hypothetical protein